MPERILDCKTVAIFVIGIFCDGSIGRRLRCDASRTVIGVGGSIVFFILIGSESVLSVIVRGLCMSAGILDRDEPAQFIISKAYAFFFSCDGEQPVTTIIAVFCDNALLVGHAQNVAISVIGVGHCVVKRICHFCDIACMIIQI